MTTSCAGRAFSTASAPIVSGLDHRFDSYFFLSLRGLVYLEQDMSFEFPGDAFVE